MIFVLKYDYKKRFFFANITVKYLVNASCEYVAWYVADASVELTVSVQ